MNVFSRQYVIRLRTITSKAHIVSSGRSNEVNIFNFAIPRIAGLDRRRCHAITRLELVLWCESHRSRRRSLFRSATYNTVFVKNASKQATYVRAKCTSRLSGVNKHKWVTRFGTWEGNVASSAHTPIEYFSRSMAINCFRRFQYKIHAEICFSHTFCDIYAKQLKKAILINATIE